jgi:hypothetical protein
MMARMSQRAKNRQQWRVLQIVVLSALLISAVVAVAYYITNRGQAPNSVTLCPADGPIGHYVLLVDKTDPLTFTQKAAFQVTLKDLIEKRVPEGALLSVFVLGDDFKATAEPLVELCNPGSGDDKSELNANVKKLRRKYQDKFLEPMLKQAEGLVATEPAKASPIIEMLQLVGINAFRKHDIKGERRLILMSDMLHNTPKFNMYRGATDFEAFAASDYGRKVQPDLTGVDVELHYLMNAPQLQTRRNLKFWEDLFSKAGARVVSVRPLEG